MEETATCSAPPRSLMAPPQIIVEELSGDDQYEDVSETPLCDRLLSVDDAWLDTSRRVRPSYRHRPAVRYKIRPGFSPTYRDSSPQLSARYHR
ncbi:unnamed protein product [Ixodes hexagonus]